MASTRHYLLKVNKRNTRTRCEIWSKLTIKIPERCHWSRFGIFIINFEHISHLALVFLLLTWSRLTGLHLNVHPIPMDCEFTMRLKQDREKGRAMFHTWIKFFPPTSVYVCIYYLSGHK